MGTHTHQSHLTQVDYRVMRGMHNSLVILIPRP